MEVSRAAALASAGKYAEGLEVVRAALVQAEALDWPPLSATARYHEGVLLQKSGKYAQAEAAHAAAYVAVAKAGAWETAAVAAMELSFNIGHDQARHGEGRTWAGHAEVALTFANDGLGLGEARRVNSLGSIHFDTGSYAYGVPQNHG